MSPPRCAMCGQAIQASQIEKLFCDDCQHRYDQNTCECCGVGMLRLRTVSGPWICASCQAQGQIAAVSEAEIAPIRTQIQEGNRIAAIQETQRIFQVSLKDAVNIVGEIAARRLS